MCILYMKKNQFLFKTYHVAPNNKCSGTVTTSIYEETCDPNHVIGDHVICQYEIGDKSSSRTEGFSKYHV